MQPTVCHPTLLFSPDQWPRGHVSWAGTQPGPWGFWGHAGPELQVWKTEDRGTNRR